MKVGSLFIRGGGVLLLLILAAGLLLSANGLIIVPKGMRPSAEVLADIARQLGLDSVEAVEIDPIEMTIAEPAPPIPPGPDGKCQKVTGPMNLGQFRVLERGGILYYVLQNKNTLVYVRYVGNIVHVAVGTGSKFTYLNIGSHELYRFLDTTGATDMVGKFERLVTEWYKDSAVKGLKSDEIFRLMNWNGNCP